MTNAATRLSAGLLCSLAVTLTTWLLLTSPPPGVEAMFPIELIRIVFVMPETPIVNTPEFAWFILGVALKVAAIGVYIGLPRDPPHHPIRRMVRPETGIDNDASVDHYWQLLNSTGAPQSPATAAKYLDGIADLDRKQCLSRLLCHLETRSDGRLTDVQRVVLDVIWASSSNSSDWRYDPETSGRSSFVKAVAFGRTGKCGRCCDTLYKTCAVDTDTLMMAL